MEDIIAEDGSLKNIDSVVLGEQVHITEIGKEKETPISINSNVIEWKITSNLGKKDRQSIYQLLYPLELKENVIRFEFDNVLKTSIL